MSVLYDFHQVNPLLLVEVYQAEVIHYKQFYLGEFHKKLVDRSTQPGHFCSQKQFLHTEVSDSLTLGTSPEPQSRRHERFSAACCTNDNDRLGPFDILACGQVHQLDLVDPPGWIHIDLFNRGLVTEGCILL